MTVVIANDMPPAIRGLLRRWFIEPRPGVYVGSINMRTREKVIDYLRRNAPSLSMLVIFDDDSSQGFNVLSYGTPDRQFIRKCGLRLVLENPEAQEKNADS